MSQGLPVVVSRTKIDTFYFEEGVVHFFPSGDSRAMAAAMLDVINNKDLRESLVARGYEYVERHGWDQKKREYLNLIDSLSTELFLDVRSPLESAAAMHSDCQKQPSENPAVEKVGSVKVGLDDPIQIVTKG
jgi:hypothetical protein